MAPSHTGTGLETLSTTEQTYERSRQAGIRTRLARIRSVYDYGFSRPDDRFIPVAPSDLIDLVTSDTDLFGPTAADLSRVADGILSILEQERSAFERLTIEAYAPFNPDRETLVLDEERESDEADEAVLMSKLEHMLEKANFERLSPDQVQAAIEAGNTHGLRVNLDQSSVESVSIWVRGRTESIVRRRTLLNPRKGIEENVATFNRLVLIAKMSREQHLHIKMFKDIPIRDVEALLPHARVKINRKDAFFMVGGGAGAIWSVATKLTIASVAAVTNLLWVLALPLAGFSWRLFSGYRRALKERDSHRARHLYYQGLGSNRSAVHTVATLICEEEIKEAVLLYAFCAPHVVERLRPQSLADMDRLIQNYLKERIGIDVDFDIHDAVETLERLGLWVDQDSFKVLDIEEGIAELEQHRIERRSVDYHAQLLGIEP